MVLWVGERMTRRSQVKKNRRLRGIDHVPFLMLGGEFISVHFIIRFHCLHTTCVLVYVFIYHIFKTLKDI